MDKRYQVFISSTFADLKEERSAVQQAVMELDCFPAGMELFPAIDEDQFEFIKKVIDDCDYYLLIIGGRYGSISPEGVSYTEMEYRYAVSKGIKVIAFLHKNPDSIAAGKSEKNEEAILKLSAFRDEVATGRLVRYWTEVNELPGLTMSSLSRTIRVYPAVGWVRGDSVADQELYKEIAELRKENAQLKESIPAAVVAIEGLADFNQSVRISCYGRKLLGGKNVTEAWHANATLGEIFGYISPFLFVPQAEEEIQKKLVSWLKLKTDSDLSSYSTHGIYLNTLNSLRIHFQALGLIKHKVVKDLPAWEITELGEKEMINLRAIRKSIPVTQPE